MKDQDIIIPFDNQCIIVVPTYGCTEHKWRAYTRDGDAHGSGNTPAAAAMAVAQSLRRLATAVELAVNEYIEREALEAGRAEQEFRRRKPGVPSQEEMYEILKRRSQDIQSGKVEDDD